MATKDEMTQDERDFAASWGEEGGEASKASPEGKPAEADDAAAVKVDDAKPEPTPPADEVRTADDKKPDDEAPTDPKEMQRQKSWEGRLKAREAELAKREQEIKDMEAQAKANPKEAAEAIDDAAEKAEAAGDDDAADKAEAIADDLKSGEITAAEAMARLKSDFGDEFVDMLLVAFTDVARQQADIIAERRVKDLEDRTSEGFRSIGERHLHLHREKIEEQFPDVNEIAGSDEFKAFVADYPDGESIVNTGTARQIIKLLKAFKDQGTEDDKTDPNAQQAEVGKQSAAQAQPDEAAIDAAAGVRSGGAKVPDAPAASNDYAGAWAQA